MAGVLGGPAPLPLQTPEPPLAPRKPQSQTTVANHQACKGGNGGRGVVSMRGVVACLVQGADEVTGCPVTM